MDSSIDEISGEDRSISELPDDILIHILSFLTATDMEAISALPRRWKSLSKLFPNRDFKKATGSLYSIQREVQLLNDKVRIREFDLLIWHQLSCSSDLTSLITEVLKHKVEKLQILCDPEWEGIMPWPDSLLTSDSLTSLKLGGNLLRIRFPTSISFPRLKTLHLYSIDIEEEHNAKQFFSDYHYPVLEELELGACRWINYDNYNNKVAIILGISISSLQRLAIANGDPANCTCYGEANESLWVRINCSNLQYLRLSCVHFDFVGGYSSLSSLAEAELELRTRRQPRHYFAHRTLEFLKIIRHVKHLELTQNTLQTMSYARRLDVPALFSNLTHLRVWTPTSIGAAPLMRILQNSPNLQSLDCPLWNIVYDLLH
ncbi:hypothetical protein COLO4_09794 [Corchorus olitorius]|uniref:F-box domain-containing protein n=1 Tax=Corchorus olitorius TaxID=93759 RepID=A0A1R3KB51_9ROSI|nr:hypothetical protein COLO4_09794 [Corchorus olitorius]